MDPIQFDIIRLPERSFYGETQVLISINSFFSVDLEHPKDKQSRLAVDEDLGEMAQVYKVYEEDFLEICKEFPSFQESIYSRGEMRMAYFKRMAKEIINDFLYQSKAIV